MCNSQAYYLLTQECKKVNSSKSDIKYELIEETQLSMEFLEIVAFAYFSLKAGGSTPSATK